MARAARGAELPPRDGSGLELDPGVDSRLDHADQNRWRRRAPPARPPAARRPHAADQGRRPALQMLQTQHRAHSPSTAALLTTVNYRCKDRKKKLAS